MATFGSIGPIILTAFIVVSDLTYRHHVISEGISELAIGPDSWIGIAFFVCLSTLLSVNARLLQITVAKNMWTQRAIALLYVISVSFLMLIFIHTETRHDIWSFNRIMHDIISSLIAIAFPLALFLFTYKLRRDNGWQPFVIYTLITGIMILALDSLSLFWLIWWPFIGLQERLMILAGLAWIEAVSVRALIHSGLRSHA
jgi:hypothetical protein